MQRPSGVGKEGRGNPNSRERDCAFWWDDIPSVPYNKGDVRKAVGRCLIVIEEGISKRPCGPLEVVGAMCCDRAFRDGLLARIADTRETSSWLHLYQVANVDSCVAALMVLDKGLSISRESKHSIKRHVVTPKIEVIINWSNDFHPRDLNVQCSFHADPCFHNTRGVGPNFHSSIIF